MNKHPFVKRLILNWKSGLTVSLISLPLAVTLAVASHATPVQGVITAIWAGLIAAIFGASNYNVIGPTGALSGLLSSYAIIHGQQILPTLAIMSGCLLLAAYFLRFERYLVFVPSSTLHGFVLGVALIIIFNQINFAFGISGVPIHESFIHNVIESLRHIPRGSLLSASIFFISLMLLFMLEKIIPHIPAALIISPISIGAGFLLTHTSIKIPIQTLESKFTTLSAAIIAPYQLSFSPRLIIPALTIAIISILETMISARIADGITKTKHNQSQELFGLSVANIIAGLAGGIPATAALARTTLNIKSGCTHKTSAAISSIFILIIAFLLLSYFKYMPLAVVAAILTVVGIRMIEVKHFKKMFKIDKIDFVVSLIVAAVTVFEDPIIGILLGATISMLAFMKKLSTGHYELEHQFDTAKHPSIQRSPDTFVYSIKGELVYVNAQAHIARFEKQLPSATNVIIDLRQVCFIDHDGVQAVEEIIRLLQQENKSVTIVGARPLVTKVVLESKALKDVSINA